MGDPLEEGDGNRHICISNKAMNQFRNKQYLQASKNRLQEVST